ncbi:MAG: DUF29 domain-containing protein [Hyphomonadaceae bacterium]|nr:DUF29 domain-containing protein [Hyphomonadaceae bacterium]
MTDLYDKDVYSWALKQADALRRRSANEIDWDNVAEEIESVGKSEARELASRLAVLICHLLKWRFQPELRGKSWRATIITQRRLIAAHLVATPSLKARQDDAFAQAYIEGLGMAARETSLDLDDFPETPPFTLDQAMDPAFWPEPPPEAQAT